MPFRRVKGEEAGAEALGILLPPGKRTLIVVRPRTLDWDLIPLGARDGESGVLRLWEMPRLEAEEKARRLLEACEAWSRGGPGRVEAVAEPGGEGYQVRAAIGSFVLVVCRRLAGQPYAPLLFPSVAEAQDAAHRLRPLLCPGDADQEVYFNTRNFAR